MGRTQTKRRKQPEYVKARVIADALDVGVGTVYYWARENIVRCYRDPEGNLVRFKLEEVIEDLRQDVRRRKPADCAVLGFPQPK